MTNDKYGEEEDRKRAVAQQIAAMIKASGLKQAEVARRISEILGRPIGRYVVNKITTGSRRVSQRELIAIGRALRYGEKEGLLMPPAKELLPFNVKHDGDRESALFDVNRLRRTILAALLSPDMELAQAQKLAEGWLESLRIATQDGQSEGDNKD